MTTYICRQYNLAEGKQSTLIFSARLSAKQTVCGVLVLKKMVFNNPISKIGELIKGTGTSRWGISRWE